jgi:putative ABC transport system ATP-binding protein
MTDLMLNAIDIHYSYREGSVVTPVLHGIDLCVRRGEFVVIAGPSGCGKSTLLHVVGLMARPDRAQELTIDGQPALGLPDAARTRLRCRKIGFVFQRFNLLPVISARENINLALRLRGESLDGQAERALDSVGLSDLAAKKPGQMSIGQQQRVAIARALACRPPLLLADEPTGNLDSANSLRVLDLLKQLQHQQGQTVVMITHNEMIADCADRVIGMRDGRFED